MTVKEWLGEDNQLGQDIWVRKYQYNNESFDEWLDRVSGNNPSVRKLISSKKFMFGGRILANRGTATNGRKITYSNCFTGDTEIRTKDGIKRMCDVVGEKIQVFSCGKWRDATVESFGKQNICKLTVRKGKSTETYSVTPDHIWYAKSEENDLFSEIKTSDLKPGMILREDYLKCFHAYKPSPFGVAHGIFYGDGDHAGECRRINLCGDKIDLIQYFMPDTAYTNDNDVTTICSIPKIFWNKPSLNETSSYLYGWLAGYFATDGSVDTRGACVICSSKREDLEFVQDVLCVLGMPVNKIRVQNRKSNLTDEYSDVFILSINKKYLNDSFFILKKHRERIENCNQRSESKWRVDSVGEIESEEEVFCVVEPEKHSFTLKNGILTHNCYVLSPPEDNIESIFDTAKKLARTFSYGGGVGIDIGKLSPRGAAINNAAKTTSGSVSFMDLYSLVTGLIGQAGRRGALMISIPVDHPDVEEFVEIKNDLTKVTKANISVRITDRFMAAVKNHEKFTLSFTREETGEHIEKEINAYDFFHKLCEMNWNMAEPGVLFWDKICNWNLLSNDANFKYSGVNPCAEEPLPAGGSCLLGSMNLAEFVKPDKQFDFEGFRKAVSVAVVGLNEVLDEGLPLHPLKEQRDSVDQWRQIGLGIMGLADCLIKMEIKYGSEDAIYVCDMIGHAMADEAIRTSALLAKDYGAYTMYDPDTVESSAWFTTNALGETKKLVHEYGLRNSQLLTSAPTGTLSTMLGISGGIEPIFANYYNRKTESLAGRDQYYKVYTPIVKKYMEEHSIKDDAKLPKWFITAHDLYYKNRISMQAIWQKHIDASISSTINLPNKATVDDIFDLYLTAWEKGLKGVTIFRDGCARTGILTTDKESKSDSSSENISTMDTLPRGYIVKADDNCVGKKRTLQTGCGTLHVEAFFDPDDGRLLETYFSRGSSGGCSNSYTGLSRMISLAARGGVDIYSIVDQLKSSNTCPSYAVRSATKHDTSKGSSCPVAIGNALMDMYKEMQYDIGESDDDPRPVKVSANVYPKKETIVVDGDNKCPICGDILIFSGGCRTCQSCGWSKCD